MGDLLNTPVVIDNGSGTIRAGYAGEDSPRCFFPSYVGRPKYTRVLAGGLEGDLFFGNRAQELRGLLKIRYPLEHGIVTDWDDMEKIWTHVYSEMSTQPEDHPVLLTEAPLNPRANREAAAEVLFERFNVPALYTSIQAVLSLYASGRTTGIVLDSGDGVSHAVPVYEGFAIPNSIRRIDVAGRDVTEEMQKLLRKEGSVFHTSAEKEIVKAIKEKVSYVALDVKKEEKEWQNASSRGGQSKVAEYVLPDGKKLKIGPERYKAAEILFDPEIIGLEWPGLHQIIVDSINRTDMDLRKSLFGNIVLSGGSTMIKGFGDRLLHEVQRLALKDTKIKIFAPPERLYSTWIGGSILAGLSTFRKMYVKVDDWHESKLRSFGVDDSLD